MDDLDQLELQDAAVRHTEGGGAYPLYNPTEVGPDLTPMPQNWPIAFSGMGHEGSSGPWYKSPTWLAVVGVGLAAIALVVYKASNKKD